MLLGVDVGGTFTDAVLLAGDRLFTAKSSTTPDDQSRGAMAAIELALEAAGAAAGEVHAFAHGTTVTTNALLEGDGARTALVATAGFTDVVELGRQARPELYRLCAAAPPPLSPPELRFAAPERAAPDGVLEPLGEVGANAVAEAVAASGAEAVAVVLLHSYAHPEHERMLGEALARRLPDAHVSLSHEVVGTFREFERAATTEIDAALSPLLARYLRRLLERTADAGLPEPQIMQSSGGLASAEWAASHGALTVLSGPAGGAAAAALLAELLGEARLLCVDMGGTSCDVCTVADGRIAETAEREVAGRPLALPAVDIHTVGAGGGSIAWRDAGGALRVGPRSAGADPGPACYGRGGTEPTVTDANLCLGRLDPEQALAGVALDASAATAAIERLAGQLGLEPRPCAEGIVRVANAEMARAVRVVTVERGVDPREYALLAFGGAGPLHAAELAAELGVERVLCVGAAGVLSALGLAAAERRRDVQRSVLLGGEALTDARIAETCEALAGEARAALGEDGAAVRYALAVRYSGQSFELTVEFGAPPDAARLREAFEREHAERYGYRDAGAAIELVTVRASGAVPGAAPALGRDEDTLAEELHGPARRTLPSATLFVPEGWTAAPREHGVIELRRAHAR